MTLYNAAATIAAGCATWIFYRFLQIGKRELDLPPGPPTIPLLGNLHLLPKTHLHVLFTEWAEQYGEIVSLKLGPNTAIVLTSVPAIREIMEKKSAVTSERAPSHMVDITAGKQFMLTVGYNDVWRKLRRGAHELLNPQTRKRLFQIQHAEATQLMQDLVRHPQEFYMNVRRFAASVILSNVFGKRAPSVSSPDFIDMRDSAAALFKVLDRNAHPPVDALPFLQKIPERFASWKGLCRKSHILMQTLHYRFLGDVERRRAAGEENGCFIETACEKAEEWDMDRGLIADLGGVLLGGGVDPTTFFIHTFMHHLVAFPAAQEKAQDEIDRVIGLDRAPVLEDLEQLPYVNAFIREVHRFTPVAPLGIPHATSEEVMYKGYRIPTGSIIFLNIWGIFHDEGLYEDAHIFNPDRYMKAGPENKDWREDLAFGCGRRICPGMQLAEDSIAINALNLLWGFNFEKAKDSQTGAVIEPQIWDDYISDLGFYPRPFKCTITPRSQVHTDIIERQYADMGHIFSQFERELGEEDRKFVAEQRGNN